MELQRNKPVGMLLMDAADGTRFDLFSLRGKRPVVLLFAANTSRTIEQNLVEYVAEQEMFEQWGADLILIAGDEQAASLEGPFTVLPDLSRRQFERFGVMSPWGVLVLDRYNAPLIFDLNGGQPIRAADALDVLRASELSCAI